MFPIVVKDDNPETLASAHRSVPLYQRLASLIDARLACHERDNSEWFARHEERAEMLAREYLPSGSGFDGGTQVDFDKSTGEKLVLNTGFHHMDQHGSYDGWTYHSVTVRPSLVSGFDLRISGRDRRDIKDYIAGEFREALSAVRDYDSDILAKDL